MMGGFFGRAKSHLKNNEREKGFNIIDGKIKNAEKEEKRFEFRAGKKFPPIPQACLSSFSSFEKMFGLQLRCPALKFFKKIFVEEIIKKAQKC